MALMVLGQLTRSLLLEPRATVNVKPSLQIIADEVRCPNGAAMSDLEESQLFYFKAHGVDSETDGKAPVFSFGGDAIQRLLQSLGSKTVENHVKGLLDPTKPG